MHPLLKKLNYKEQYKLIYLRKESSIHVPILEEALHDVHRTSVSNPVLFMIALVQHEIDIQTYIHQVKDYLSEDPIIWFLYPKKSSKTYRATIDRDHGWQILGDLGFEPVRQVAIDENWSALRFRSVKHIKELTRKDRLTK